MVDESDAQTQATPPGDSPPRSAAGVLTIPRWVQLATLPVLLLVVWFLFGIIGEPIFIFLVAALIALVLNPLVRLLERVHIPRYVGVFVVYIAFVGVVVGFVALLIPPLATQVRNLAHSVPGMVEDARGGVDGLQRIADRFNVNVDVHGELVKFGRSLDKYIPSLWSRAYIVGRSVVSTITVGFLIIVISIYMLLDSKRLEGFIVGHFPTGSRADGEQYAKVARTAVVNYIKAQVILSLALGASAGGAMWLLGVTGVFPSGDEYALFFGAWTAVMEAIPYLGPVLAAVPPSLVALLDSPLTALWVILTYLAIQQIEGHILVPVVMGARFRVHPLIVIFAVLAGGQIHGIMGMLLAIPLIPLVKETIVFMRPRVHFEGWRADATALVGGGAEAPLPPAPDERDTGDSSD
jgi:predicted PurR-regulated permease PerM